MKLEEYMLQNLIEDGGLEEESSLSWNHRLIQRIEPLEPKPIYGIHEVYYNEKDEVVGWTENPVKIESVNIEDIKWQLEQMMEALNKEVIKVKGDEIVK